MRKSFFFQTLVILLMTILLSSCGSINPKGFSGQYYLESYNNGRIKGYIERIEFFSDGHYSSDHPNYHGEYSIDGNRIWLEGIGVEDIRYYFRIMNGNLELDYQEDFSDPYILIKD